tara:strand:- start:491 stop:634 length:144 start_codon:yes stop_codon:yes gene_type:complete
MGFTSISVIQDEIAQHKIDVSQPVLQRNTTILHPDSQRDLLPLQSLC